MRLRLLVKLEPEAITDAVTALPEVGERSTYRLTPRRDGFELQRREDREPHQSVELLRQHLRARLRPWRRPGVTEVRASVARRVNAAGVGALFFDIVGFAGLHSLLSVVDLRATLRARRAERVDLLNLLSRALSRHAVPDDERGPYRAR